MIFITHSINFLQ
ncbi:CRISPR-associated DxTHG motif protein [Chryseobacterium sp. G0240]|nr:CRISPR-associated DxTHG motif protein [Chryseobacterium sp. G0240]